MSTAKWQGGLGTPPPVDWHQSVAVMTPPCRIQPSVGQWLPPKHIKLLVLSIWRSLESPGTPVQHFTGKSVYDKHSVLLAHSPGVHSDAS